MSERAAPAARVLILSCIRDEGPHLIEWIAHHRAAGVTDFLIYSNDCSDGSDTLLDLLHAGGIVTHLRNAVPKGRTAQWAALGQAAEHPLMAEAEWIACLDCDEFLNLRAPLASVQELIAAVKGADGIAMPWRLFGHNGHASRPDLPTTEAYTRAAPADALYPALTGFVKTLYRRAGPFRRPGVHRPKQKGQGAAPRWVDGAGRPLPEDFAARQGRILLWGQGAASGLVQLNHYSLRSAEDFMAKRRRGLPNHTAKPIDLTYWVERNFNTVTDDSIARMAPATAAECARLRALPGVAEAEAAALAHHRDAFRATLGDPEEVKLYGRLLLAGGSRVPDSATARQLVALYQAAQAGKAR